jgi:mannosyltransferase OCH1-like enzyme
MELFMSLVVWIAVLFCVAAAVAFFGAVMVSRYRKKKKVQAQYDPPNTLYDRKGEKGPAIPRLLHRIWIGPRVFPPYKDLRWMQSFDTVNDDFTTIVWKDSDVKRMIEDRFPEFADLYRGYRLNIQRADLARYLVLYEYGGMYADLDMAAVRPVRELFDKNPGKRFFCFVEIVLDPERAREIGENEPIRKEGKKKGLNEIAEDAERIASYAFLCTPRHPVMLEILKEAVKRAVFPVRRQYDVFYTTGPDMFTSAIHRCKADLDDLAVIPKKEADRFLLHHGSATWKTFINFGFR